MDILKETLENEEAKRIRLESKMKSITNDHVQEVAEVRGELQNEVEKYTKEKNRCLQAIEDCRHAEKCTEKAIERAEKAEDSIDRYKTKITHLEKKMSPFRWLARHRQHSDDDYFFLGSPLPGKDDP